MTRTPTHDKENLKTYAAFVQDQVALTERLKELEAEVKAVREQIIATGQDRVIGDPMQVAYNSVYLWKMAVEKAKSFDVDKVIAASGGIELEAPEGTVRMHANNHHVWKKVRVGRARADGQFDIVWEAPSLVEPNPFPKI
mgnify:CR=1 FL=1